MRAHWTRLFGYLTNPAAPSVTPVWVGEFGPCADALIYVLDRAPSGLQQLEADEADTGARPEVEGSRSGATWPWSGAMALDGD
jgi:hypothetical protein